MDRKLRLVRRAQFLMLSGLLASYLGTQIIDGAVIGLIALGVFPVVWIPLYKTLTDAEDALAVVASRFVERYKPGSILVACEGADVILTAAAILFVLAWPQWTVVVLICYLVVTSVLPLLVDLAEDFYLNDLGQIDTLAAIRGNVVVGTGTAILGLTIGRATGALSSEAGVVVALAANMGASLVAIALRTASRSLFEPSHEIEDGSIGGRRSLRQRFAPAPYRVIRCGGPLSPIVSGVASTASALVSTYILIWIAADSANPAARLAVMFLVIGVANAVIPPLAGRIVRRDPARAQHLLRRWVLVCCAAYGFTLMVAVLSHASALDRLWALGGIVVFAGGWAAFKFTLSTARQIEFKKQQFREIIGWSYSLSALGALFGTWAGFAAGAATNPVLALTGSLLLTIFLLVRLRRSCLRSAVGGVCRPADSRSGAGGREP